MFALPDQFTQAAQTALNAQLDTLLAVWNKQFDGLERALDVHLSMSRGVLEDGTEYSRQLCMPGGLRESTAWTVGQVRPAAEKWLNYARHMGEIAVEMRSGLGEVNAGRRTRGSHPRG